MVATKEQIAEANAAAERLEKATLAARTPNPANGNRLENMLNTNQPPGYSTSRGTETKAFSLHRFMCLWGAKSSANECPHETDVLTKYQKALVKTNCNLQGVAGGLWLPMNMSETYGGALTQDTESENNYNYVKSVMEATRPQFDPDEARWLERRRYIKSATTPQSAYDDLYGGALVAPPIMGEVIPIIRPTAAFLAAGAQAMTLPPNGRFVRPRITGVPSAKALGEGQTTLESNITTGQMELTAKKIAGAVIVNEEATAFTSGTLDAIAQAELGRTLGLTMDGYAFYGRGDTLIPAGITNNVYAGKIINIENDYPSVTGVGGNGNKLLPQYGDIFPALIGERSFNMDANTGSWIMRPGPYATAVALRADAVTPGDQAGTLVDIWRRFQESSPSGFRGRKVVLSTNIDNTATKNTGTALSDVFFGIWSYAIMASYGAINFQQGHNGTTFMAGQYIIRGTMYGDIGFLYPGAFLWYPNVIGLSNNF